MTPKNIRQRAEREEAKTTYADDYHLESQIGYVLRKVHQRASEIFNQTMSDYDISPMQFATLVKLHDFTETSQNRLGRLAAMDPATTLGVVTRLKRQDLINQRKDPNDKRRILLSLTPKGVDIVEAMRKTAADVSARTLSPLSRAESRALLKALDKLA